MIIDVSYTARKLKITSKKVIRKTKEYLRLAGIRVFGQWPQGEETKKICCMVLAAKTLHVNIDQYLASNLCASDKDYQKSMYALKSILKIKDSVSINDLAAKFLCIQATVLAKSYLAKYKKRFLQDLPPQRQKYADFSKPVYIGVAFYLASKQMKKKVNRQELRMFLNIADQEFSRVITSFHTFCPEIAVSKKRKKTFS